MFSLPYLNHVLHHPLGGPVVNEGEGRVQDRPPYPVEPTPEIEKDELDDTLAHQSNPSSAGKGIHAWGVYKSYTVSLKVMHGVSKSCMVSLSISRAMLIISVRCISHAWCL
jgi:hypothetical protein